MNKVILVAHGKLAHEMKKSAEMIFGCWGNEGRCIISDFDRSILWDAL